MRYSVVNVCTAYGKYFEKTTQDVLFAARYLKPNLTSHRRRLLAMCWTNAKAVFQRELALVASVCLWLIGCGRWLAIASKAYLTAAAWIDDGESSEVDGGGVRSDRDVRCEVLYDPGPECTFMDVVFIHGLRGDKLKTWKQGVWKQAGQKPQPVVVRSATADVAGLRVGCGNRDDDDDDDDSRHRNRLERLATDEEIKDFTNCWPRDWLPLDCPYVRVITISYSTDPYLWRPIWLRKPAR